MPDEPPILNYATPEPAAQAFACNSRFVIVLLTLIVPGLSSSLIRRSPIPCLLLCPAIPMAFVFSGPIWWEAFSHHPMREWGIVLFLLVFLAVPLTSILLALKDRTKALSGISLDYPA
ncbi:MAG: hypothetical protein ABSH20_25640 [Tepidisphaeraceae bacterium]|jgi:hypothetical protein